MPNWCHNTLKVSGPEQQLKDFVEQAKTDEQPLSFGQIIPEPAGLTEREMNTAENVLPAKAVEAIGDDSMVRVQALFSAVEQMPEERLDWYHWRCLKWGTKWDANFDGPPVAVTDVEEARVCDGSGLIVDGLEAHYSFLTAWSPPEAFCISASVLFSQLTFELTYAEPGCGGAGRYLIKAGKSTYTSLEVDDVLAREDQWY